MKIIFLILFCGLFICNTKIHSKTYYITPEGQSSNTGNNFNDAIDYATAFNLVEAGDSILLQEGTYSVPYIAETRNTILLSKSGQSDNPIYVLAYDNTRAIFDFSFPSQTWVQDSYGFEITGNYWYFKGISITRAGYQGVYVKGANNTFENCLFYENRNTGLEINKGGSYTTVINCDAYRNYDPKKNGSMADGFGPKQTQGPGNKFIGCRAWENSDDGYDCYDSPEIVTFENCWAFRNGVDIWQYGGFDGNGNGFKIGGYGMPPSRYPSELPQHVTQFCLAFHNKAAGFYQNHHPIPNYYYNNTSFDNGTNYNLLGVILNSGADAGMAILRNNIAFEGRALSNETGNEVDDENNSWNLSFNLTEDDFQSIQISYLRGTSGYILVVDGTRKATLDKAFEIEANVEAIISKVPFVVVINKSDLTEQWELDQESIEKFSDRGITVVNTSAKTGEGVENAFIKLGELLLES